MIRNNNMNKWQLKQVRNQSQYQAHTRGLMPPHHTRLGNAFIEIEYIKLIQYLFPLMLPCRNVTLRSNYTVSKRDTSIQLYRVKTWHSDPIISLSYHLLSPLFNSLIILHQAFFIQGITLIERFSDYKSHGLRILDQSQTTQPSHTITQSST